MNVTPESHATPQCDFCGVAHPSWVFPGRDVHVSMGVQLDEAGHPQRVDEHIMQGDWAACDACAALIQAGKREPLVQRSIQEFVRKFGADEARRLAAEQSIRHIQGSYWRSRRPGAPQRIAPAPLPASDVRPNDPSKGPYAQVLDHQDALRRYMRSPQGQRDLDLQAEIQPDPVLRRQAAQGIGQVCDSILRTASPYYWAAGPLQLLDVAARTLPEWTLGAEQLPTPDGLFWFEQPLRCGPATPVALCLQALAWGLVYVDQSRQRLSLVDTPHTTPMVQILAWSSELGQPGDPARLTTNVRWPLGQSIADVLASTTRGWSPNEEEQGAAFVAALLRLFGAALAFLGQKVYIAPKYAVDRHTRRRHSAWVHEPAVRVIELRRAESRGSRSDAPAAVDWQYQWLTRGHWRQQAYGPHWSQHKPIYVAPFLKGPPDRPLKPPRPEVFVVKR